MNRPTIGLLILLAVAAVMLNACSSSKEADPGGPGTPSPPPLLITDLAVIEGTSTSLTLVWTSPQIVDKATIRYDLRYIEFGSENTDWNSWTVVRAPDTDAESGQEHRHVITSLPTGEVFVFGLKASTDGVNWTEISNISVATVGEIFDTTPPARITGLFLFRGEPTSLTMNWPIAGDDGIYGQATSYEARYSDVPIDPNNWATATPVPGDITASSIPGMMETVITGLTADQEYHVAVKAIDNQGLVSDLSNVVAVMTVDRTTLFVNIEGTGDYPTVEEAVLAATIGDLVLVGPGRYTWANQATGDSLHGLIHVPRYYPDDDYYNFEVRSLAGAEATILDAQSMGRVFTVTGGSVGSGDDREYPGITIDGFTFTNGKATATEYTDEESWSGGGLNLHLTSTVVRNCIFTGNEATEGGALWVGGQGYAVIENCLFENNRGKYGGGVTLINSLPRITMRDCTIRNNYASHLGGGMVVYHATATLENLMVVGNDCSDKGGGIYFYNLNPDCEMIGCTVAANDADPGAGIMLENVEEGLLCESTLLAFNIGSAPFSMVDSSEISIGCTVVFGNDVNNFLPNNRTDLGGNFEADPLFCDQVDYLLQEDSPCLPGNHPGGNDCGTIGARGVGCAF